MTSSASATFLEWVKAAVKRTGGGCATESHARSLTAPVAFSLPDLLKSGPGAPSGARPFVVEDFRPPRLLRGSQR
jgi:hypothetical protein